MAVGLGKVYKVDAGCIFKIAEACGYRGSFLLEWEGPSVRSVFEK